MSRWTESAQSKDVGGHTLLKAFAACIISASAMACRSTRRSGRDVLRILSSGSCATSALMKVDAGSGKARRARPATACSKRVAYGARTDGFGNESMGRSPKGWNSITCVGTVRACGSTTWRSSPTRRTRGGRSVFASSRPIARTDTNSRPRTRTSDGVLIEHRHANVGPVDR